MSRNDSALTIPAKDGMMKATGQKVFVLVSTRGLYHNFQAHYDIPQVDISMLLQCYPGSYFSLFGLRISAQATQGKVVWRTAVDILFRACTLSGFLKVVSQLRSREWTREELQPSQLSNPYPIQTVSEDQMALVFSGLELGLHKNNIKILSKEL